VNPTHTRERRNERNEEAQERHPKYTVTETVPGSSCSKGNHEGKEKPYLWGSKDVESGSTKEQGSRERKFEEDEQ